jgi:uncharacterized cupredoxin-like copper-binding protein
MNLFSIKATVVIGALTLVSPALVSCAAAATTSPSAKASTQPTPGLGFIPGTKDQPRVVTIFATDQLMFTPATIKVATGETVTFQIKNTGTLEHEFMIGPAPDALADKEGTPEIAGITGGTTKAITFTFDGPGPYAFACHATGHFEAGMKGTITLVGG